MKECPNCGVMLTGSLVERINDDDQPESCPRAPKEQGE